MSKVTVISAIYNIVKAGREKVFRQNLLSVHNQTHKDIQHLIIDGGSTDGTAAILEKYRKKGWIEYMSEPDNGIFDAMNKGARLAAGDYIAFLNSDDYWFDPRGIAESVAALEAVNADFSFAPSYTIVNGFPYQKCPTSIGNFFMRMPFCHQTMLTRKDTFLRLNGFDAQNYRSAADYHFILRLILSGGKPVFVNRNFTAYSHGGYSALDIATSSNECTKAMTELYGDVLPGFTSDDAVNCFYNHTVSREFIAGIKQKIDPVISEHTDQLPQHDQGNGKIFFDIHEYSQPAEPADFEDDSPWIIAEKKVKLFCLPVLTVRSTKSCTTVKLFGMPLWRIRRCK